MRRNWEMIRAVLLDAEEAPIAQSPSLESEPCEVQQHISMLMNSGYLAEMDGLPAVGGNVGLTWAGYELVDAIRDEAVWRNCQTAIAMNGGGLPTDLLLDVARHHIRNKPISIKPGAKASDLPAFPPGTLGLMR